MGSQLSCLIVTGTSKFPEEKLRELLAPQILIAEFDYANSLSAAFQFLLDSNFNLCLIGAKYQTETEPFFRDMQKLGRDKTCAFVKVRNLDDTSPRTGPNEYGFCASITEALTPLDIKVLKSTLSKEVLRIAAERRVVDVPKYVSMILKEIDLNARKQQRGLAAPYDKVIAALAKEMMSDDSIHKENFLETLSKEADQSQSFESTFVDIPEAVLEKKLPKLSKKMYAGRSARVWDKLLKRYGDKNTGK